jgi:tripartite ATP-independent transporter DctP family solute receptor
MLRRAAAISIALSLGGAVPAMAQDSFQIRYAGIQGRDDAATKAMFRFKDEVEQKSAGRIKVQIYYQTQLAGGNTIDQLRFLKIGAIEMNNVGFAQMSQEAADFGAVAMPFLFTDTKAAANVLRQDGRANAILSADADKDGLKLLGYHFLGLRNLLMAKKPVRTLADLKGLKLRVVQGQVPLATYRALGANPVPMDFAEVPAGMTQGVIDGTDLPVTSVVSVSAYSYGHFYTILRSYIEGQSVMINKAFYNKLPPDLQQLVVTAVGNECAYELTQNAEDEKSAIDVLKSKGTEVIDLPPDDLDRARNAVQAVYSDLGSHFTPGLLDALQGKN